MFKEYRCWSGALILYFSLESQRHSLFFEMQCKSLTRSERTVPNRDDESCQETVLKLSPNSTRGIVRWQMPRCFCKRTYGWSKIGNIKIGQFVFERCIENKACTTGERTMYDENEYTTRSCENWLFNSCQEVLKSLRTEGAKYSAAQGSTCCLDNQYPVWEGPIAFRAHYDQFV